MSWRTGGDEVSWDSDLPRTARARARGFEPVAERESVAVFNDAWKLRELVVE